MKNLNGNGNDNLQNLADGQISAPLNQSGDASQAELNTMDAIVNGLNDVIANTGSTTDVLNGLSSSMDSMLAAIQTSQSSLYSICSDTSNILTSIATAATDDVSSNTFNVTSNILTVLQTGFASILTSIGNVIDSIQALTSSTDDVQKSMIEAAAKASIDTTKAEIKDTKGTLDTMLKLVETFTNSKQAKKFKKNKQDWQDGFEAIASSMQVLEQAAKSLSKYEETLQAVASISENLAMIFTGVAKASLAAVASIGALFAIFTIVDGATMAKTIIGFPVMCAAIAGGLYIIGKALEEFDPLEIKQFAMSSVIFASSLLIYKFIDLPTLLLASAGFFVFSRIMSKSIALMATALDKKKVNDLSKNILAFSASTVILGAGVLILSYAFENIDGELMLNGALAMFGTMFILSFAISIMGGAQTSVKDFGWTVLAIAASILVLGFALPYFQEQIQGVKLETFIIAGACILALAGSVALMGQAEGNLVKGAIAVVVIAATLYLLPYVVHQYDDLTWEQMAKPGAALVLLTGAVVLAGLKSKQAILGAVSILLTVGALYATALVAEKFDNVSWGAIGKIGACVGGIIAALYLAGASSVVTLLGAAALLAGAASLKVMSDALTNWPELDEKQYAAIADGIVDIGLAIAGIGLLTVPILAGSAAGYTLGKALYELGSGLNMAASVDMDTAGAAATSVINWAKTTAKDIADGFDIEDFALAMLGIEPIYKLGTALGSITSAIQDMANGTYNEYEVVNGEAKLVGVKHIGPEVYAKFAESLDTMITGITDPLAKFGEGANLFSKSDTEKGIDALQGIGSIIDPIIEVAKNTEAIAKADFSILGSRVRDFFGIDAEGNVQTGGFVATLKQIGDNDDDIEDGIEAMEGIDKIINPFIEIAKNAEQIGKADFTAFGEGMLALKQPITEFVQFDTTMPDGLKVTSNINGLINSFKELGKFNKDITLIKDTAIALDTIANVNLSKLNAVKSEAAKELYKRLDKVESLLSQIDKNTENTTDAVAPTIPLDPETGKPKIELKGGETVDMGTIALMLQRIMNAVELRR